MTVRDLKNILRNVDENATVRICDTESVCANIDNSSEADAAVTITEIKGDTLNTSFILCW